jgi:DNA-binding MarR family transcriptional regulator
VADEAVRVGLRYLTVGYQVRRTVDERMTGHGSSLARTKILQVLARRGAVRQSELANELGHAPRSVTQAVEALERDGLVERGAAANDRRAKLVVLTRRGTEALAAGTVAGERAIREVFGALSPTQLAELDAALTVIEGVVGAAAPISLPNHPSS